MSTADPNILFILMDNLGYGEVGCYGGGLLRGAPTPNIDTLAREGTKLLNFNVEPQCTPSRSCVMTGRHSIRSGTHSVPLTGGDYGLVQWEQTIAKLLSAKGYATGHFGKWHLGNVPGRFPTDQGFDEWYGIADTSDETVWSSQPEFAPSVAHVAHIYDGTKGGPSRKVKPYDLTTRPEIDMEITDKAIDFMQRGAAAKRPFYAYVPYTLVHFPTLPSAEFKGATGNGDWADCLAQIDHNVGRLLDTVDRLGVRDDTIVIFTSDNGADTSTLHKRGSAGPWAGTMFTPMEGSNRVPFIVRWPGRIAADRESDAIVHEVDTFTTLLRLVGADVPDDRPIDGVDQSRLFVGETDSSAREGFPIYFGEKLYAAKWRNYKLHFVWQVHTFDAVSTLGVSAAHFQLDNQSAGESRREHFHHTLVGAEGSIENARRISGQPETFPPIVAGTPGPYVPPNQAEASAATGR